MEQKFIWGFTGKETTKESITSCVGPGWKKLVEDLMDDLLKLGWNGVVIQCKEKFGGLRFYIGEGSTEIFQRIGEAEETSYTICEECGEPGELRGGGWVKTLCEKHAKEAGRL